MDLLSLVFLFTVVPAIELYLLIQAGEIIGAWDTIGIVILTGVLGAFAAKSQGRQILSRLQNQLQRGEMPGNTLIHGLVVFVGGVLLITPGFLTDLVGLSFVLPFTRPLWVKWLQRRFRRGVNLGQVQVHTYFGGIDQQGQWRNVERDVSPKAKEPEEPAKVIDISDWRGGESNQNQ